jgi:hypothetical protein
MADNIVDTTPLRDLNTTRQKLILKELCLANEGKVSTETTLHASSSFDCDSTCRSASACFGIAQGQGSRGPTNGGGDNTSNRNTKKKGSHGGGGWQQHRGGWQ